MSLDSAEKDAHSRRANAELLDRLAYRRAVVVAETRDAASDAADTLLLSPAGQRSPTVPRGRRSSCGGVMTSIPRDSDIIAAAALLTLVLLIRLVRIFGL